MPVQLMVNSILVQPMGHKDLLLEQCEDPPKKCNTSVQFDSTSCALIDVFNEIVQLIHLIVDDTN